jgi:hypothetical protein
MRRKEIFFKQLSFILGIIVIVSFVTGTEVPLPLRSESKLYIHGGDFVEFHSEIIIKQGDNKITIEHFSNLEKSIIEVGIISIEEFQSFWDSLNTLNFWKLKTGYNGVSEMEGDISGEIIVSYEKDDSTKIVKGISFGVPRTCADEFKRVYELFVSMLRFAKSQPELKDLLRYKDMNSEKISRLWYPKLAAAEMGRIKNKKYLDTLLILLPKEIVLADGIVHALENIGDKKAIPILKQFLNNLDTTKLPSITGFFYTREGLIQDVLSAIISLERRKANKDTLK